MLNQNIGKIMQVSSTGTAIDVRIANAEFLICNTHATLPIYIKEKSVNEVDSSATAGFMIPANTLLQFPLCADTLSVYGANGATAQIMVLESASTKG